MPQSIRVSDFSQGWCPSDSAYNGRANGLLQMENLELDMNGALMLAGGAAVLQNPPYSAYPTDLYSRYLNGIRYDYAACSDGSVWRNATRIITGGNLAFSAFGTAYNSVIVTSGAQRFKDSGTGLVNLGVGAPTVAPGFTSQYQYTTPIPALANLVDVQGSHSTNGNYLRVTYATGGAPPASPNNAIVQSYNVPGAPFDWTVFPDGSAAQDSDYIQIDFDNFGTLAARFTKFTLDILLTTPDAAGDQVSDYFSYMVDGTDNNTFGISGAKWTTQIARRQFTRIGSGSQSWESVYGFRLTINCDDTTRTYLDWYPYGNATTTTGVCFRGGSNSQDTGFWQFAQMNVNNSGAYIAKSSLGPATGLVPIVQAQSVLSLQDPTGIDSQVNEVWVFARSLPTTSSVNQGGAALEQWYRIAVITKANFSTLNAVLITGTVESALATGITVNTFLVSIAASSITDNIHAILGPMNGRWYYVTDNFIYPSDINDPDLVDTSLAIRIGGSISELVMWAKVVSDSMILVGTSVDIYLLTGTFQTLPDNSVDVYFKPLGCAYPPITYDATAINGQVFYYGTDGWRSIKPTGENINITAPNIDRLYRNENPTLTYTYKPAAVGFYPGQYRSPITAALNKLWCWGAQSDRIDVYDFVRQYWRPYARSILGTITALGVTQDGKVLATTNEPKLYSIGINSSKLVAGNNSTYFFLTPVLDGGTPHQRKDSYTVKVRAYTGTSGYAVLGIIKDDGTLITIGNFTGQTLGYRNSEPVYSETQFDIQTLVGLTKNYQISVFGISSDFILSDIEIEYETRPMPLTFLRLLPDNFGAASPKRMRDWPQVIDTLGNNVKFQIIGDNSNIGSPFTLNSSVKQTFHNFITSDAFATDYGATLSGGPFEYYGSDQPDFVQILPPPRFFDQIGPEELFKYGRIKQIELRCYSDSKLTQVPFSLIFNDGSSPYSGVFAVIPATEASYFVGIPKGYGGEIVRITLGPTVAPFYRYYLRLQCQRSGADTELVWVTLPLSQMQRFQGTVFPNAQ